MKRMKAGKITALLAALLMAGCSGSASGPKQALEEYIGAMKAGNFQTVYELNATTQKKVILAYRGAKSSVEPRLKKEFDYYKGLFDTAKEGETIGGQWEEKFFLISGVKHSITKIEIKEDTTSPSAKFKAKEYAIAEIVLEYGDQKTAPSVSGKKVKKVACEVKVIKGQDAVKGLPSDVKLRTWLFKSLSPKPEGIVYF